MDVIFPIFGIFIIIIFIFLFFFFIPVGLWVKAWAANVKLPLRQLIGMRLRKIPPGLVADALISSRKAGLGINIDQLETHYLASGNVVRVTNALIASGKAGIDLNFEQAAAIDLAGRDVLEAVKTSVNPIVIDCPTTGKVSAVARDGIQLLSKARVTVRTNIERLVGGATQETIIARVGEGIVSAIGSSATYKDVLENPDNISKTVLKKGLDSGTAYEILSIDIADIDVGQNVGAYLMTDQAEADLKVARAKAETRRAMAIAREQEMKAAEQEMRAKVVEAEVLIPEAMADSFRKGNLGILDYYRFRNIEADTSMRDELAKSQKKGKKPGDESK